MANDLTDDPLFQALLGQVIKARCEEVAPGVWRCNFGPDGFGATHDDAKRDALWKAVRAVYDSLSAQVGKK